MTNLYNAEVVSAIDFNGDLLLPIYFIAKYAEEINEPIITRELLTKLHNDVYNNLNESTHRYVKYIHTNEYPPQIDMALKEWRRVYEQGTGKGNH